MKHIIRPAMLPAVALALAVLALPVHAQGTEPNYSAHGKTTPSDPPAEEQQPAEAAAPPASEDAAAAPAGTQDAAAAEGEAPGEQAAASKEGNALGVNDGWSTQFGTAPPETSQYTGTPEQVEIVEKINAYFNDMKNLEGRFVQTDASDKQKKGHFFIERPGKVLFDYSLPSREKIISNGEYLAIENHDLNTTDRYPLESTPFRLLLKDKVDLANDAQIVALDVGENIVVLTVEDKEARGAGQIRLFFEWPELQLREWIITDAQGLNTRIELAELETNKEADPKLFKFSKDIGMPNFRGGSN